MELSRTRLENVAVEDLKPFINNYQSHEKNRKYIINSLEKFGYVKTSIVIDEKMELITGHGTLEAIKHLGWSHVPTVDQVTNMPEKTKRAYRIADNETGRKAQIDKNKLIEEVEFVGLDFDLMEFGLDEKFTLTNTDEDLADIDNAAPALPEFPTVQSGELWKLGRHYLFCGDSTKQENLVHLMGESGADLLFTDPPYGVAYADKNEALNAMDGGNRIEKDIENDEFSIQDVKALWEQAFNNAREYLTDKASYYICSPTFNDYLYELMQSLRACDYPMRHIIIWNKNNHVLGRSDYNYKHELIFYGWLKTHDFYKQGEQQSSVWNYDKPMKNDLHPTMKPIALIQNAILNSTQKHDHVLDIFGGSGSTLLACELLERTCFTIEIDPGYCDVIIKRWEELTGKKAEKALLP